MPTDRLERKLLKELLAFVAVDARWWLHVAKHCKRYADGRLEDEKAELYLLCAIYHERAKTHKALVAKIRQQLGRKTSLPIAIDSLRGTRVSEKWQALVRN